MGSCQKKILVIEQDEATLMALENALSVQFNVLTVDCAKRALQMIRRDRIDAVVLALCLPDMDGLEVLRRIKQTKPLLPVYVIAAKSSEDLILSAFRAGADDFFRKPLKANEIRHKVESALMAQNRLTRGRSMYSSIGRGSRTLFLRRWFPQKWLLRSGGNHNEAIPCDSTSLSGKESEAGATQFPTLRFTFLGKFEVDVNEDRIAHWPGRKGRIIFAYLAFHHRRRIYRDVLMDQFWPDSFPESARNCLNVTLHGLRNLFHEIDPTTEYIRFKDECYFINQDIEVYSDTDEFQHYWRLAQNTERTRNLEEALGEYELAAALYRGDFLEEDIYESWTNLDRENLKETYMVILDRLSKHYSLDGKPMTAINLCKNILVKDPCREDIHARLMRCYCRIGQRDKALKQFQQCSAILKEDLEVEPTPATRSLFEKIKANSLKDQKLSEF